MWYLQINRAERERDEKIRRRRRANKRGSMGRRKHQHSSFLLPFPGRGCRSLVFLCELYSRSPLLIYVFFLFTSLAQDTSWEINRYIIYIDHLNHSNFRFESCLWSSWSEPNQERVFGIAQLRRRQDKHIKSQPTKKSVILDLVIICPYQKDKCIHCYTKFSILHTTPMQCKGWMGPSVRSLRQIGHNAS